MLSYLMNIYVILTTSFVFRGHDQTIKYNLFTAMFYLLMHTDNGK